MRLESVHIENFRSIERLTLEDCGQLNVFIGKNNSGKSNILLAIDGFFSCLRNGALVNQPRMGAVLDFHKRDVSRPINLTLNFALTDGERLALFDDIKAEAPQLKNAVDDLSDESFVSIELLIVHDINPISFVSQLAYVPAPTTPPDRDSSRRILLGMSTESAREIVSRLNSTTELRRQLRYYSLIAQGIGEVDWQRMRDREAGRPASSLALLLSQRTGERMPAAFLRPLEAWARRVGSYAEFTRGNQAEELRLEEEASSLEAQALENKVVTFAGEESTIPTYAQNFISLLAETRVLHLTEDRLPIGPPEATRLLDLKVRRGGSAALRGIQETVSALLGVQIDAFSSDTAAPAGEISAELDVDNFLVQANGSGIREALRLVLDFEFMHPALLLVEEPEVHLHPALETTMMQYLKRISDRSQVFVTTHSTNFLDTAEMKNVSLVSKNDVSTSVQLLDLEAAETQLPSEMGLRLSSLFMYDRLVFVEGPSDEAILRELATCLGINLSQPNVGFITMGGVRNFTYYAADATLSFLSRRRVHSWFLLDRDERNANEVKNLRSKLADPSRLYVLERRQLENYLLIARAIKEFINVKLKMNGVTENQATEIDASAIENALSEVTEDLRIVAIERRIENEVCRPLRFSKDRLRDRTAGETMEERAAAEIKRLVADLEKRNDELADRSRAYEVELAAKWELSRLEVVPGDLILDGVSRRFGARYVKGRDGGRLASVMQPSEIAPELVQFLRGIASGA